MDVDVDANNHRWRVGSLRDIPCVTVCRGDVEYFDVRLWPSPIFYLSQQLRLLVSDTSPDSRRHQSIPHL